MKRLLSLLLAFSIILTIVPTTVFAAPTTSEALEITNPFTDVKGFVISNASLVVGAANTVVGTRVSIMLNANKRLNNLFNF